MSSGIDLPYLREARTEIASLMHSFSFGFVALGAKVRSVLSAASAVSTLDRQGCGCAMHCSARTDRRKAIQQMRFMCLLTGDYPRALWSQVQFGYLLNMYCRGPVMGFPSFDMTPAQKRESLDWLRLLSHLILIPRIRRN